MDAIEQLRREREVLLSRLSKIEDVLAEHAALQRKADGLLRGEHEPIVPLQRSTQKPRGADESVGRRVTADVAAFEQEIRQILLAASKPLDRSELLKICLDRGISIGGKEPLNTLASRMSRMDGVTNIRGKGYFLAERLADVAPSVATSQPLQSLATTLPADHSPGQSASATNLGDLLS